MSDSPGLTYFLATRYLSGVGLTVSLWDHLLIIGKEIELIWRQPATWSTLQTIIVLNRYAAEASMIFVAYIYAGCGVPLNDSACRGVVVVVCVYGVLGSALSQFVLLLRAYSLWDNKKPIKYTLVGGFIVCLCTSVTFAILVVHRSFDQMEYFRPFKMCTVNPSESYVHLVYLTAGVWGGMLLYDVYVFVILIANAMNRPRRHDSEIITSLIRDGVLIFLACLVLRIIQLAPDVSGNIETIFLTPSVAWSLDNILTFRLFLKMKAVESPNLREWKPVANRPSAYVLHTSVELSQM